MGMNRGRSRREIGATATGATRERILDVAEAHLAEVGYRAVSLAKVAQEVGLTKPSLYYHFPEGKAELVVAILHRSLGRIRTGLEHAMAGTGNGAAKLRAAAGWLTAEPGRARHLRELHDVTRFVAERHHAALAEGFVDAAHQPIRSAIAAAIASGEFRGNDPDFLAWSFLALAAGLIEIGRVSSGASIPAVGQHREELVDPMVDLFLEGALTR